MQAQDACRKQLQSLYDYFSRFTSEDYPQLWQQNCIKYIYSALTTGIKIDVGIGHGGHPFEDRPPMTMLASEAILADELLNALTKSSDMDQLSFYQKTFEENGVQSNSWNYVWVKPQGEGLKKLQIIKAVGLRHRPSDSLYTLVKNCYIGGMQKLAEYKVWLAILTATGETPENAEADAMTALNTTGF